VATRPGTPTVRRATTADAPAITDMLVRAFDDDPVSNFMFAGPRRRRLGLHSFFRSELGHHYLPHGQVYVTNDLSGAALWGPPGRVRHPVLELLQLSPTAPFLLSPHTISAVKLLGSTRPSPTGTCSHWGPHPSDRVREWDPPCCAPCSR
jgi:hypothetical protein